MVYYGGNDYRDYLSHHGVLGMKWGIRRYQPYSSDYNGDGKEIGEAKRPYKDSFRTRRLKRSVAALNRDIDRLALTKSQQKDYDKAYKKNYVKIYNMGAAYVNANIDSFNKKWEKKFKGYERDWSQSPNYQEYLKAGEKFYQDAFDMARKKYLGERPGA